MKVTQFEDLIAWQKAQDIAVDIFTTFESIDEYSFRNQIFRASVSISNNIAEGFERNSNKDFARFLKIGKGSCGEVRSMTHLAKRLNLIDDNQKDHLITTCMEESKILGGLIRSLNV